MAGQAMRGAVGLVLNAEQEDSVRAVSCSVGEATVAAG